MVAIALGATIVTRSGLQRGNTVDDAMLADENGTLRTSDIPFNLRVGRLIPPPVRHPNVPAPGTSLPVPGKAWPAGDVI